MPEAVERPPRRDTAAADMGSLVRLGREDPPPIPAPVFQEPAYPGGAWTDGTDEPA
jgi:hypothetical protein